MNPQKEIELKWQLEKYIEYYYEMDSQHHREDPRKSLEYAKEELENFLRIILETLRGEMSPENINHEQEQKLYVDFMEFTKAPVRQALAPIISKKSQLELKNLRDEATPREIAESSYHIKSLNDPKAYQKSQLDIAIKTLDNLFRRVASEYLDDIKPPTTHSSKRGRLG